MLEVELITKGLANQPLSTADTANSTPSVLGIFEILGIDGRALAQYRVAASQNMNFDVNEGVYLVKVTIGNKQAVSKIIVGM